MNNEVTLSNRTIRKMAWDVCKGKYWQCVVMVLLCDILAELPSKITEVFTENETILFIVEAVAFVLEIAFDFAMINFMVKTFRNENPTINTFTDSFALAPKAVVVEIISQVQIFLYSLLFIIPGIICSIKHAQGLRVLSDHPEYSPMQCIHGSHHLMEKNVFKYFTLKLSFLPWMILGSLPLGIYGAMFGPKIALPEVVDSLDEFAVIFQAQLEARNAFLAQPIPTLLGLISVLVTVYVMMADACFYDIANGNLIVQDVQ